MILSLKVKNYTLIENLYVEFGDGLSTITGETGAGKSILLGALGLVLGKRADIKTIKNQNEKCIIEAEFNIKNYNLATFFEKNNLDYRDITSIRREILPNGKSRGFINDTPITLDIISELGENLVDIHSQFQTLKLNEKEYQFYILDSVAKNQEILKKYQYNFGLIKNLEIDILSVKKTKEALQKTYDYNLFLYEELEVANLKIDEQKELESILQTLNNSEYITEVLNISDKFLRDENVGVLNSIRSIKSSLQKICTTNTTLQNIYSRIDESLIELDDISNEIEKYSQNLEFDPNKQKEYSNRLDLIYNLQKKHNVDTVEKLLEIKDDLEKKTLDISELDKKIKSKEEELIRLKNIGDSLSEDLYKNRLSAKYILEKSILETINSLGMEKADIDIRILKADTPNIYGNNNVEFLFSANSGIEKNSIAKSISGGEMSRVMLAIKRELSKNINLPCIIFDEIDSGVSGNIADKMGDIMKTMSEKMQVIAITHLPQVASKGKKHYKVSKKELSQNTVSEINLLSTEERIEEIAKMISGENITQTAINHAKDILNI